MLKQLPFALTPELYEILYRMGHGDELVVADANFPADSCAKRLCTMPDMDTVQVLELVLNYERTKNAYAVILTGERRRYGNIILRKGVVEEQEEV